MKFMVKRLAGMIRQSNKNRKKKSISISRILITNRIALGKEHIAKAFLKCAIFGRRGGDRLIGFLLLLPTRLPICFPVFHGKNHIRTWFGCQTIL